MVKLIAIVVAIWVALTYFKIPIGMVAEEVKETWNHFTSDATALVNGDAIQPKSPHQQVGHGLRTTIPQAASTGDAQQDQMAKELRAERQRLMEGKAQAIENVPKQTLDKLLGGSTTTVTKPNP